MPSYSKTPRVDRFIEIIVATIIPPVAVFMRRGLSWAFVVNILLSSCILLPGTIHAWWIIAE